MEILLIMVFGLIVAGIIAALVYAGIRGGHGPRYQGEAPHKGPVMRFTGMSSEVKEDQGNQPTTQV